LRRHSCAQCGKPFSLRRITSEEKVTVEISENFPPYTGNLQVVREYRHPPNPGPGSYVPMDLPKGGIGFAELAGYRGRKGKQLIRTLWDGESIGSAFWPFCSQSCGMDYGRAAYLAKMKENDA